MLSDASATELGHLPLLDAALWSYRLFLGRNPESAEALSTHIAGTNFSDMRQRFLMSREFQGELAMARRGSVPGHLIDAFPSYTGPGAPGFFIDFLGTRTRCSYLPEVYAAASGIVEGRPGSERFGIHEPPEWAGTLRSVLEAQSRFVAVELGAGWGPWLVAAARAAQIRGITDIRLAGVEGAEGHYAFMLQHFRDNGLDPDAHLLLHAVAGDDGVAHFPKLDVPADNWGAQASYDRTDHLHLFDEVRSISIPTLLAQLPPVDLLHCDIQGAEGDVLTKARDVLTERVRRMVVGTHGRAIEGRLLDAFGTADWVLEHDDACRFTPMASGALQLAADGVQVWRNTRLQPVSA